MKNDPKTRRRYERLYRQRLARRLAAGARLVESAEQQPEVCERVVSDRDRNELCPRYVSCLDASCEAMGDGRLNPEWSWRCAAGCPGRREFARPQIEPRRSAASHVLPNRVERWR